MQARHLGSQAVSLHGGHASGAVQLVQGRLGRSVLNGLHGGLSPPSSGSGSLEEREPQYDEVGSSFSPNHRGRFFEHVLMEPSKVDLKFNLYLVSTCQGAGEVGVGGGGPPVAV